MLAGCSTAGLFSRTGGNGGRWSHHRRQLAFGVFTELKMCPSYNSALMFLGSEPEELKFCVHISDALSVFIAFIIARIWR